MSVLWRCNHKGAALCVWVIGYAYLDSGHGQQWPSVRGQCRAFEWRRSARALWPVMQGRLGRTHEAWLCVGRGTRGHSVYWRTGRDLREREEQHYGASLQLCCKLSVRQRGGRATLKLLQCCELSERLRMEEHHYGVSGQLCCKPSVRLREKS